MLAALGGVAMAFDMPARQAFMVEMTSREHLMNAVSLNSSIVNGARVVGPAVAGFLMAHVGMTWCFLLNGFSFIAVIAGLVDDAPAQVYAPGKTAFNRTACA